MLPLSLIKRSESSIPFDLTSGPLVRFHFIRLSARCSELIFTAHHMVCDGWSFGMILAELASAYNARKSGALPKLPPAMSFADYARLEAANVNSAETLEAENYWVSRFSDGAPVLDLPTDRPRPVVKILSRARWSPSHWILISISGSKRLHRNLAAPSSPPCCHRSPRCCTASPGRRTSSSACPAAGQTRIGRDELVGHCLNFLPLRLQPSAARPFADFAAEVKEQVLEAYDHQNHTFGSLLRKIKYERDASRVPLVSVIFNIDKSGIDQIRFDELEFDVETNPKHFVNFDLFFNLVQSDERMIVECEYNTDLHDASTIRQWLAAFEQLIESVVSDGGAALQGLDLLTASDRDLLDRWNATDSPLPDETSIHQFFEQQTDRHPHAIALRAGDRSFTYQELDRHANALASVLRDKGVDRHTLVAICAARQAETIVAILAVLKAGGAYVPIDPKYPRDRINYILKDAAAPLLLTQKSLVDTLPPENGATRIFIDGCLEHQAGRLPAVTVPEDLAYVIYTSGSTGEPKGVAIEHRNTIALIGWARGIYQADELAGVLFSTSICFDLSIFEMFVTLATGGSMILAENALDLRRTPAPGVHHLDQHRSFSHHRTVGRRTHSRIGEDHQSCR